MEIMQNNDFKKQTSYTVQIMWMPYSGPLKVVPSFVTHTVG